MMLEVSLKALFLSAKFHYFSNYTFRDLLEFKITRKISSSTMCIWTRYISEVNYHPVKRET